jgi:hypothetical protein
MGFPARPQRIVEKIDDYFLLGLFGDHKAEGGGLGDQHQSPAQGTGIFEYG